MQSSKTNALTAQFYEWEILGRGWLSAGEPVDLEPPFTPFFGHSILQGPIVDDGLRHTILSRTVSLFKRKPEPPINDTRPQVSYDLFTRTEYSENVCFNLVLSKQSKAGVHEIEQLLVMLSYCTLPISFEIIGGYEGITFQLVCRVKDCLYIKSQLVTFIKGIAIVEKEADEYSVILPNTPFATVDFGLKEEFMRPLGQLKVGTIDPYTGLLSILEHLREGEQVVFQVLFNGLLNHWPSSIIKSVTDSKGGHFFENAPEMVPLTKEKLNSTLLCATIRLLAQTNTLEESFNLLEKATFAIVTNSRSQSNELLPLTNPDYTAEMRATDIAFRESHRAGMIINAKELATFVHIPDNSLLSKKITGQLKKSKLAPPTTEGHQFILGLNMHNGIEKKVSIDSFQRLKHTHIIGATGTGKSSLLIQMIKQDIEQGRGIAVLDPHGDLIDSILSVIPESRTKDVLLLDPSDSEYPVGFNILKAHSDIEKEVLSSDLVAAFRKLSTSWGDQMNSVFANAILAVLESTTGGTLINLRRFLIEKPYREEYLKSVPDPSISYYWQKEYPLLKTNSTGPILTRLDAFLRPRLIRNMVAQPQGIDFETVLQGNKILLVKLSQGLIGAENSYLLGSFVVSKIHQAALARQATIERGDFFLYIDEFQHFITPSMAHILSGARKYHVGLVLAHQDLQQVQKADAEILNTLLSNAGTRICFRLGDADARRMAEGFSFFEVNDFQNLGTGEAIVRIEKSDYDFSLSTSPFILSKTTIAKKELVIAQSRKTYSTPRNQVEALINESMGIAIVNEIPEVLPIAAKPVIPKESPAEKRTIGDGAIKALHTTTEEEVEVIVKNKEETQHRYLQSLVKKMAESKGYKAVIELPTPDGKGSVDVSIEGNNSRIACEISVTTERAWELHNIKKCLSAGYVTVFVCCADGKAISGIQKVVAKNLEPEDQKKVTVTDIQGLFEYLEAHGQNRTSHTEETMKGYRVKVEYDAISDDTMQKKRESVAKLIMDAMKKFKK